MEIDNFFQMNDWEITKFIRIVISIQLAVWGCIGMDYMGFNFLILRPLISFFYLTFIPGYLILRILKLHNLGNINSLIYSAGLSIFTLIVVGLITNLFFPLIGILNPLSIQYLILTMSLMVIILTIVSYYRDRDYKKTQHIKILDKEIIPRLFLYTIPFLTIISVYIYNTHNNNLLMMILIFMISLIPILISYNYIPNKLHELAIFIMSISLLYHRSLISTYLFGWDINVEYYFSKLVLDNSYWDPTLYSNVNGVLSIVILAPAYSIISGLSLIWTFKIIYPLLFSLVPLALYSIFEKQTNRNIAFLSTFFLMSVYSFYSELSILPRQEIAELFLVLLISVMLNKDIISNKKRILLNIFAISVVVSHYGLAFIFMFNLVVGFMLLFLFNDTIVNNKKCNYGMKPEIFRTTYILLFVVMTIFWYMQVSNSSSFTTLVNIFEKMSNNIIDQFLNPEVVDGVRILNTGSTSYIYKILKYLHVITMLFISVGIIKLITNIKDVSFEIEYSLLSICNFILCIGGIVLPYFASSISVARLYHMTLLFLAPFCIIGGISFLDIIFSRLKSASNNWGIEITLKVLSIFFASFFLFNSGFIHEIVKDKNPASISLNKSLDYPLYTQKEVSSAIWIKKYTDCRLLYADPFGKPLLYGYISPTWKIKSFMGDTANVSSEGSIFLRQLNIKGEIMTPAKIKSYERPYEYIDIYNSIFYKNVLVKRNLIYTNSGSSVYR